jgi:excisionase family DNA binding protein
MSNIHVLSGQQVPVRLSYAIEQAVEVTGIPRTRFYGAIASGELRTFKHGRRRFVSADALREWILDLERKSAPRGARNA